MAMHDVTIEKTIMALLEEKKYQTLKDILVTMEPSDIVSVFEDLKEDRIPLLFRLLPKETAAEVFAELDHDWQALLIKGFSDTELKEVIDDKELSNEFFYFFCIVMWLNIVYNIVTRRRWLCK